MRLYSYVVARDYGFAPNPFYGVCTLATCKPMIRRMASVGDWVVGTGSAGYGLEGHLVYAMRVTECLTFDHYFADARFQLKKPNLSGSLKQAFGDNIYHRDGNGDWLQLDSHHSFTNGSPNARNTANDTQTDRVLLSDHFAYFGAAAVSIPADVRCHGTEDAVSGRGYKVNFSSGLVARIAAWLEHIVAEGVMGRPRGWHNGGALMTSPRTG